jgi:hypothetical protein
VSRLWRVTALLSRLKKKDEKGGNNFKEEIKELFLQQSEMLKADLEKVKNKTQCKSGSKSVPKNHIQAIDVNWIGCGGKVSP